MHTIFFRVRACTPYHWFRVRACTPYHWFRVQVCTPYHPGAGMHALPSSAGSWQLSLWVSGTA